MTNKNSLLFLGILSLIFFAACKKTDNGPVLTPQQKALTSKIWKLQSLTVPQVSDPTKDSSIAKSCSDSALIAFDVFGNFQLADATKSCDSSIVPYDKGVWALSMANDSLLLKGKRTFIWKIKTLNDSLFKATFRDSIAPDKNWVKTITFK